MRNNKLIKIKIWGRKSTQCVTEIKKKRDSKQKVKMHIFPYIIFPIYLSISLNSELQVYLHTKMFGVFRLFQCFF